MAPLALEVLVHRMGLHVCSKIGTIGEGLAAVRTSIGLLARVRSQVTLKQPGPREQLATDAATVG